MNGLGIIGEKLVEKGVLQINVRLQKALAEFQNNGGSYGVALAMLNAAYGKGSGGQRTIADAFGRSAECSSVGRSPTEPEVIRALVLKARAAGVVVFLRDELERMPAMARAVVEGEHKRICEGRTGR